MVTLLTLIMVFLVPIRGPQFGIGAGGPDEAGVVVGARARGQRRELVLF
jgi:hypothetical protein